MRMGDILEISKEKENVMVYATVCVILEDENIFVRAASRRDNRGWKASLTEGGLEGLS
jgi:hypothetical protein